MSRDDSNPLIATAHSFFSNRWSSAATLVVAGALQTLTFSPFHFWWFGPVSMLLILLATLPLPAKKLFFAGLLTGLGLFGSGASWVYISISEFGNTPIPVAVLLTVAFVAVLALFPALAFWFWGKLAKGSAIPAPVLWRLRHLSPGSPLLRLIALTGQTSAQSPFRWPPCRATFRSRSSGIRSF
mgnify:CR=1 FL=1